MAQDTEGEPLTLSAAPNSVNIPPEGAKFRLRGRDSKHVIYSRPEHEPLVGRYLGPEYDDQIFILVYGRNNRSGLYLIKSWFCNKILFSRRSQQPYVGNIYGNGDYDDNWFQFVQDGNDADSFRIYCPATNTVLYSRLANNPTFSNFAGPKYNDQLFRFERVN